MLKGEDIERIFKKDPDTLLEDYNSKDEVNASEGEEEYGWGQEREEEKQPQNFEEENINEKLPFNTQSNTYGSQANLTKLSDAELILSL